MSFKLLFVIPPELVENNAGVSVKPTVTLPLGVLYMAAFLRQQEWAGQFEIYDARLSAKMTHYPDESVVFGDTWAEVAAYIETYRPDAVGISNMFSWQIENALEVARLSREVVPEATTIIGGPHASSFPLEMVDEPAIDFVVMGEGEERLLHLLEALAANEPIAIQGVLGDKSHAGLLSSNRKAPIKFIAELDRMPLPAYDLIDVERYFYLQSHGYSPRVREYGNRAVSILTSRGCPHQCIFCSVQATMGYKFRWNSADYVAEHIALLRDEYNIDYIHFEDDNFTHDIDRYDEILDVLLAQERRIPWGTPNGVRADSWNLERIRRTKESGCRYLVIAIESSVQRVIDEVVKKKLDLSQVEAVMQACKEVNLPLSAFYVLGLPGETADEIRSNVDFAIEKYRQYGVYPTFSMANPLPGTELFDIAVAGNLFQGATATSPPRANTLQTTEFDTVFIQEMYDSAIQRKAVITIGRMLTSPRRMVEFVSMSLKNRWFFRRILSTSLRSLMPRRTTT